MKWYRIPDIQNIDKPFIKKVKVGDKSICLIAYEGNLFALSAICPHAGADLSQGWCENEKLICPFHGYAFDLQTGKGRNDSINTYPVKIQDDTVYIGIKSFWDKIKQH